MAEKIIISFALDSEQDRRIIRWLNGQPNRSAAIRDVLTANLGGAGLTLGDVYRAVQALERKMDHLAASGAVVAGVEGVGPADDDPDLTAAFANIADLGL